MDIALVNVKNLLSVLDILIVAVVIYWIIQIIRRTRAERMLWGLGVVIIAYFVSLRAELLTLHWILSNFLGSIIIFIIVVFQQDIRRGLTQMGRPFISRELKKATGGLIGEVVDAVIAMSGKRTGCLIVFERSVGLSAIVGGGVEIDSAVKKELLISIFNTKSPMHDGAVLIRGARVFKAGGILPLSKSEITRSVGTRHRAALGIAEETDALALVVSEQTGEFAIAVDSKLHMGLKSEELLQSLTEILPTKTTNLKNRLNVILPRNMQT
ncbi:MAG: diadenylate cyclase CdaA [Thermodesulfobacteriota bacterium]